MNDVLISMNHVFQTPALWSSLGVVCAIALFVSPILYNGDYRAMTKVFGILTGYVVFMIVVFYFHFSDPNHVLLTNGLKIKSMLAFYQDFIMLLLIWIAYTIGLYLGVFIHRLVHPRSH